jgi:hypothetical protein
MMRTCVCSKDLSSPKWSHLRSHVANLGHRARHFSSNDVDMHYIFVSFKSRPSGAYGYDSGHATSNGLDISRGRRRGLTYSRGGALGSSGTRSL